LLRVSGNFVICVHGSLAPSQAEWNQVLELYRRHPNISQLKTLVWTDGGAPNAAQRSELTAALAGGKSMPIAVITASVLARAAGTALTWLNPGFRLFGPNDFDRALDHLGAGGVERRALRELVEGMRRELSSPQASASGTSRDA